MKHNDSEIVARWESEFNSRRAIWRVLRGDFPQRYRCCFHPWRSQWYHPLEGWRSCLKDQRSTRYFFIPGVATHTVVQRSFEIEIEVKINEVCPHLCPNSVVPQRISRSASWLHSNSQSRSYPYQSERQSTRSCGTEGFWFIQGIRLWNWVNEGWRKLWNLMTAEHPLQILRPHGTVWVARETVRDSGNNLLKKYLQAILWEAFVFTC